MSHVGGIVSGSAATPTPKRSLAKHNRVKVAKTPAHRSGTIRPVFELTPLRVRQDAPRRT